MMISGTLIVINKVCMMITVDPSDEELEEKKALLKQHRQEVLQWQWREEGGERRRELVKEGNSNFVKGKGKKKGDGKNTTNFLKGKGYGTMTENERRSRIEGIRGY